MNPATSYMNGKPAQAAGCGCCGGQCGCDSRCCELDCLVRPHFFCGQLLTDADLAAMVEWTRARLALARYRDGWGIACGLDLSCSAPGGAGSCRAGQPADAGPAVYLNAGYALDCCGNDLVVCEPIRVDLGPACRAPDDPCDPRATPPTPPTPPTSPATVPGAAADAATQASCLELKVGELIAVRLSLRYHEEPAQGQRAMFRGACQDDGPCQYARVLELPCVHLEEVPLGGPPDQRSDEERWRAALQQRIGQEVAAISAAVTGGLDALLRHIRNNPPYQFCYLEEMVCCLRKTGTPASAQDSLNIGKLLFMDWLLRQLQCPCGSCLPDDGVPLGRIILRRSVVAGRAHCSVVMIEQSAADRRPLRKDPCRPLDPRQLDLGPYLGQAAKGALEQLHSRGIDVQEVRDKVDSADQLPAFLGKLEGAVLTYEHRIATRLEAHLVDDIAGTTRIAFFLIGKVQPQ
ncbi:hypothetical protein [Massilia antarctica]|uniref:hypothetical protein n=1 Tax=Massilia antarctica TaxID=2765360 RepID=UPI000AD16EA2|nr:hypothetical protein [Massilia sp. H27-R4]MCY0916456.1 hypothetical protein [Massilia sp. H27-R4]